MLASRQTRLGFLVLAAVAGIAVAYSFPPIAQNPAYHDFADGRAWFGIPNFGNVVSNLPFVFLGLWGLISSGRRRSDLKNPEYIAWMTFFTGVFLTGFGSGYYHLAPDNDTLVFDRLPMTISFMGLFSALFVERVSSKAGLYLLPGLLAAGFLSVWYWHYTETLSHGDLRPYAIAQFLPMLEIILIICLFPVKHKKTKYLVYTAGCYILAKGLEYFDPQVFTLLGTTVSGHTLKHLAAAGGVWWTIIYLQPSARGQKPGKA
jgi:hypothetical protein